ncbi:2-succinyl-5-enolpyruvyl-6-hydroxy-3-cyclohexene-1-carboxylic-acid synthase [Saccharopolyspora sp. TS4A08]|uniref:2-succinyl-5-enolpyruvyl-6-hydroxy-3-cyclohexene-1-carboxylate synthase n=1 Tax=Saccharopolyspora ipomoeae TaxID=3042027 RepID=A0ABT6PTT4_9PSEU|nr:2-succinyl-5-enolpyruvyl-6-hydroxy-3-cyclohexene-1-carboxylic-acid synthase [Saccharopolyspora sp. TS4A08]MDI2031413.1 2-succinyl-5-enolpyruvyl-6-hydroxy-3-cyclohexene-1-carboxylic-acid synthase [Saccharopolyspora sp. TS4A08]
MNPSTDQANAIVDELIRCGAREAVLCPGSRNAPLAFALHRADSERRLRLHVRIDERSAGFLATGLAMRAGGPVPVVCTSGTAAANLHPAVLEADHAGLPLVAITADRPVELRGTGAGQTIDQHGLFGSALRCFAEMPTAGSSGSRHWRTTVDRVVSCALGSLSHDPGPVQLNVPLREPLVPDHLDEPAGGDTGRAAGLAWSAVVPGGSFAGALPLSPGAPTLVIAGQGGAGPVPPELPVLAEPGSPLWHRSLRSGPLLLAEALSGRADQLLPEQVVVLGRPTMHRSVQRLLADDRVAVFAVPHSSGDRFRPVWTDVPGTVRAVGGLPSGWEPPPEFGDRWRFADRSACAAIDRVESPRTTGPQVARALLAGVPPGSQVFAGPSNAIRDIALAADPRPDVAVLANRGVAGIDGVVSSAVGAALTHDGPSYALLGDLTFLHDSNGLLIGPDEPVPQLTIVVANDDGGSIFTVLEQGAAAYAPAFERIFGTPQRVDIAGLCAACGIEHVLADDPTDLAAELVGAAGIRVVEVRVDRSHRRELHERLRAAVSNAIADATSEPVRVAAASP